MKKVAASLLLALMLLTCWAQNNPVRTTSVREQIDLTGPWSFKADPKNEGDSAGWFKAETDKTFWPHVNVSGVFGCRTSLPGTCRESQEIEDARYGWIINCITNPGCTFFKITSLNPLLLLY